MNGPVGCFLGMHACLARAASRNSGAQQHDPWRTDMCDYELAALVGSHFGPIRLSQLATRLLAWALHGALVHLEFAPRFNPTRSLARPCVKAANFRLGRVPLRLISPGASSSQHATWIFFPASPATAPTPAPALSHSSYFPNATLLELTSNSTRLLAFRSRFFIRWFALFAISFLFLPPPLTAPAPARPPSRPPAICSLVAMLASASTYMATRAHRSRHFCTH